MNNSFRTLVCCEITVRNLTYLKLQVERKREMFSLLNHTDERALHNHKLFQVKGSTEEFCDV